nr:helix-turn-helix domain-containing protein [Actinotalea ferrariae]
MISGAEIRSARERARLTQEELASRVGVSHRTVGNWERGASVPRNREAALLSVLADHLDAGERPAHLRAVSDAELLAEIARRFARGQEAGEGRGQQPAANTKPSAEVTAEGPKSVEELRREANPRQRSRPRP